MTNTSKNHFPTQVFAKESSALSRSLQDVEAAVRKESDFFAAGDPPRGYRPTVVKAPAKKVRKEEKDLLIDVAALLRAIGPLQGASIYWIHTADNLSNTLHDSGFCDEALFLRQIYHPMLYKLYVQHGEIYASDLAASYNNLSSTLSKKKRYEESLTAMRSAMDIRRQLAKKDSVFIPEFALTVYYVGSCLATVKKYKEAMHYIQEAIDVWLKLTEETSDCYRIRLARAYQRLGFCLGKTGRVRDSLQSYRQAIAAARETIKEGASATSTLAYLLHDMAFSLMKLGKPRDALPLIQEAVVIYHELKKGNPSTYKSSTRRAVNLLRTCQFGGKCVDAYQSLKKHLRLSSRSTAVDEA